MLEVLGWFGAICFAICGLPQCIKIFKTKSATDISWLFLILWLIGEVLTTYYVLVTNIKSNIYQYPLLINYAFNFLVLVGMIYGKIKYSKS